MSDDIPPEVLLQILLQLPVKVLLKCRCVSKIWYSIISDPTFITTHLDQTLTKTTHNNANMVLFRAQKFSIGAKENFSIGAKENFTLHIDDTDEGFLFRAQKFSIGAKENFSIGAKENFSLHIDDTDEGFNMHSTQLNCPHRSKSLFLSIVGYCNGVMCLADDYLGYRYRDGGYALWNPSINKSVSIPDPNRRHGLFMHSLGFGFDAVNNDYKLVRLVYVQGEDREFEFEFEAVPPFVQIYSLRSGSWRDVTAPAPNYVIDELSLQAFVNGACHWTAHTPHNNGELRNVIVSFDLGNEIFSEMDVPESLVGERSLRMAVTVLGGSIALVPYNKWPYKWRRSVWVMREYGVAESWTELFDIGINGIDDSGGWRVVGFRKNGEVLVVKGGERLFSFDSKNQKFRRFFGIEGAAHSFYMDTFVESLVLLNDANRDEAELQEQASS